MNAREFFYLVANMRTAQREYFKTRDTRALIRSKDLEREVDEEVRRVKEIIAQRELAESLEQ